jgi:hypothetical protein
LGAPAGVMPGFLFLRSVFSKRGPCFILLLFCGYSLWVLRFVQGLMYAQIWLLLVVVDVFFYLAGVVPEL